MRILSKSFLAVVMAACFCGFGHAADRQATETTFTNPLFEDRGPDPWVLHHNGMYYYMHTMGGRLELWKTDDITAVKDAPHKTVWIPTDPTNSHALWAPEIHNIDGKWYIYYAADDGDNINHRMYVLENENADPFEGEFKMKGRIHTRPGDDWAIDGSVFEHKGKWYMVWSGWEKPREETETQCIFIASMKNPWTLDSERVVISRPELEWERHYLDDKGNGPSYEVYVNEGPQPLLDPSGKYVHITYSASAFWTPYYALGLLTADADADLLDPASWSKSEKPVFRQKPEISVFGTGHNSFFTSPDGSEHYIIYHARDNQTDPPGRGDSRTPRMQRFEWHDGYPQFGEPLPLDTVMNKPSGTVQRK